MSKRPYEYGFYSGQQGQQPHSQAPSPFPQSFNQPPPVNPQQPPYAPLGNYATVNNSYQYNASSIPGLGMGSFQPSIPYGSEKNTPWKAQSQTAPNQNIPAQALEFNLPTSSKQGELSVSSHEQTNHSLEEGELSEGEFEDLYEPNDAVDVAVPTSYPRQPSATENPNGSVGDADGSSIYDGTTPQGETAINSASTSLPAVEQEYSPGEDWEPDDQERERSGSYSPYLSPREIQRRASVSKPVSYGPKPASNIQPSLQSLPGTLPGINMPTSERSKTDTNLPNRAPHRGYDMNDHGAAPAAPVGDSSLLYSFQSVAEAKKKAQEAILGLWPLKIRYQDYIEEGFDEKLMKGLFTDLGLEASIPKSSTVQKSASDSEPPSAPKSTKAAHEPAATKDQPSATPNSKQPLVANSVPNTSKDDSKSAQKTAAEERKDKIARKLAARAQRTVPIVQPSTTAPPSQPASANADVTSPANMSPAKPKTRAENNAILHQKLAALKKAQEKAIADRKLAVESSAKPATPPTALTSNPDIAHGPKANEELPSKPSVAPTITAESSGRSISRSASTGKSSPKEAGIPGLFLATQPAQQGSRNLKRPVASDFDSYSSPAGTLKRSRTQEPLIIDVSDDEDVEMDIGSPIDEPSSSNGITNQPSGQTPLGAFPPLSNSPSWKQRSSPGSSAVPTPPVHGVKLNLLNKRIEEAKRQIAEAEAKKAAKRVISQSPQAQPSSASTTPRKISEVPETLQKAKRGNVERRDRIVSFELPSIDADLQEKQERLRQAVAQAAQLEFEIQASIEERRKLTAEMEELADSPGPITPETSLQTQSVLPGTATAIESSHVEPQYPNDQELNTEAEDVLMSESQDINKPEQRSTFDDVQPSLRSSRASSSAGDQHPVTTQSPHNLIIADQVLSASPSNQRTPSESASADMILEDSTTDPNAVSGATEIRIEEQDHGMAGIPEQLSQVSSPSSDGSYRPQSTPISPVRDTPLEPENLPPKPISLQEDDVPLNDELLTHDVLDDANPYQLSHDLITEARGKPSGEVQKSSSHEHLLLTDTQDELEQKPRLEDLLSYHSPLGYFRAYRFHPKYFDEVAGGLKSMTYSSRIDPMRPICPRVLAGEQCPNGNSCEFQHFESMVLPDAEIITQLGSADMFTGETRNRFIEGLKKVLNDLKANKVKDFDRITRAIVKHRQEFLEDKSKVLPLDAGTS
ncbi:uncharacterized protein GGS22DRAFT_166583 [Annulohypoxylon maeteangense]|uniref:uncharacterized protein n=1 Tax=Annulohypoxylon maeteangense TaxID=1927788 RepID=UPI002007676F|nr:uncharacterized protein GGS22DRAFT_166583 [Annulohypoxylon maeteangense]KAI0883983.1 hypothetical protein GGS22DRAFT_166583 [Annulohypoxylon maeteangense]